MAAARPAPEVVVEPQRPYAPLAEAEEQVEAGDASGQLASLAKDHMPADPAAGEEPAPAAGTGSVPGTMSQAMRPSAAPSAARGRPEWLPAASCDQFADLNPVRLGTDSGA